MIKNTIDLYFINKGYFQQKEGNIQPHLVVLMRSKTLWRRSGLRGFAI